MSSITEPTTRRRAAPEKIILAGGSGLGTYGDMVLEDERKTLQIEGTKSRAPENFKFNWSKEMWYWLNILWIACKTIGVLGAIFGVFAICYLLVRIIWYPEKFDWNLHDKVEGMEAMVNETRLKLEDEISMLRNEFDERMEKKRCEVKMKTKAMKERSDAFEKFMAGLETKAFLTKGEVGDFFVEARKNDDSLDEIFAYARRIMQKEIERHAADGLGMVDYALASGGGKVLRHSEPYGGGDWLASQNRVSGDAEKMIRPSIGEPGQCFPLKGESGFVEIRLRAAIVPQAVTLEHVAKNVAYDRLDAPKECRVSGWMDGQDSTHKKFFLTEFSYDLEKCNAQTFVVEPAASVVVDTIRLDFLSNHGSASHTCIYRLRIHGHEHNVL